MEALVMAGREEEEEEQEEQEEHRRREGMAAAVTTEVHEAHSWWATKVAMGRAVSAVSAVAVAVAVASAAAAARVSDVVWTARASPPRGARGDEGSRT